MDNHWTDDPCFDDHTEYVNGKLLRGDEWRRYERMKEEAANRGAKGDLLAVAGTTFRPKAVYDNEGGVKRRRVEFVPEPDNAYDKDAVKVHVDGEHVGYVPRGTSRPKAARLVKMGSEPVPHVWLFVEK